MTEKENIRINKILKEFNIGMGTLVDFLKKKGIEIEASPSAKVSFEAYGYAKSEFSKEQLIKEESKKIAIKVKEITDPDPMEIEEDYDSVKEVIIKTNVVEVTPAPAKDAPKPTIQAKPKKEEFITQIPIIKNELKIIDKIDLNPPKKTSPKTPEAAPLAPVVPVVKKVEAEPQPIPVAPKKVEKEPKHTPAPEPVIPAPAVTPIPVPPTKKEETEPIVKKETPEKVEIEHIKTNVQKLTGPKISGTIDLSQFAKKPSNKVKRERINKLGGKKVDVSKEGQHRHNAPRPITPGQRPNTPGQRPITPGQRPNTTGQRPNPAQGQHAGNKRVVKDRFRPVVKAPMSEDQIQKQIKETYARMTEGKGKTRGSKHRKDKRELFTQKLQEEQELQELTSRILKVTEFVTVNELAIMMNSTPVIKVIEACMNLGLMVSINQRLDAEALVLVAEEFGYEIEFVTVENNEAAEEIEENEADLVERPAIVTVMGHVDHGKTSLLDYIRSANVIAGEAGGITQHIGAYNVKLENGRQITFLDTPGHEAFTAMRARGAKVTDLAIIIVAADDAIMPQTKEAINHAQAAGVPMIFAVNKIDKPGANVEKIKEQLSSMNILVEDWGGKYQCQEVSAKQGTNIDKLLDKILLEADLMELKANPNRNAKGTVIESSLDKGRGYLATILVQTGTLHVGDIILSGSYTGKVKAMYNERGQKIEEAGPSTPISILGLNGAPTAGEVFTIMDDEKEAKDLANKREQLTRIQGLRTQKHITLEEIGRRIAIGNFQELNVIIKGDVDGSIEALSDSIIKLSTEEIHVNVIHKAVGAISESDILLGVASNAIIIGFQVRPSANARKLAEKEEIEIRLYSVIYDAINEIRSGIEGMLAPEEKEEIIGTAEVREIFKISKVGTIAGCMVKEGKLTRSSKIRLIRDGIVVYTGLLGSLKRFKDDAKEVVSGYDCGLNIDGYNDIRVDDIIEAYHIIQIKRTL